MCTYNSLVRVEAERLGIIVQCICVYKYGHKITVWISLYICEYICIWSHNGAMEGLMGAALFTSNILPFTNTFYIIRMLPGI